MVKAAKDKKAGKEEIRNFGEWLEGNRDLINQTMLVCNSNCESYSGDFVYRDKKLDRERGALCRQGYYFDFCENCHRELKEIYERRKIQEAERSKDWTELVEKHNKNITK